MSLRKANCLAFELIQEKFLTIFVSTAPQLEGDEVSQLLRPKKDGSAACLEIAGKLREVRDANSSGALPIRFVYVIRALADGTWEYDVDAEEAGKDKSHLGDKVEFRDPDEIPDPTNQKVNSTYTQDSLGIWLTAFAPIRNSAEEPVAVLAADISAHRIQDLLRQLLVGDLIAMLISISLAAALAAWLSGKVTRPLTNLQEFVRDIGKGNFSARIQVTSNDEFGELAQVINQMVKGLEEWNTLKGVLIHCVRSQDADAKTNDGADVRPRRITVLVAALCGFGQLSSQFGSERVFALLNEYFSTMIDIVLWHYGSIEKSSDESAIAVFGSRGLDPHQERLALQASLAMQHALAKLLRDWQAGTDLPIFLEIGIHPGLAKLITNGAGDQLEFDSVHSLIEVAGMVRTVGRASRNRLTGSSATAENLNNTFPLTAVNDTAHGHSLFRVEMPSPNLTLAGGQLSHPSG